MNKTFLKQLQAELKSVGVADTCKVDVSIQSDLDGQVWLEQGNCTVIFSMAKSGNKWHCIYTPSEMAHLCIIAFNAAVPQSPYLKRLKGLLRDIAGDYHNEAVATCRIEFGIDGKVICSFNTPLVRSIVADNVGLTNRLAEQLRWAHWKQDSMVTIEKFSAADLHNALLQLGKLIAQGRNSLIMRIVTNAMSAVEAQAKYANVPLIVGGV